MEKLSENKYPLVQNHKKSNDRKPMGQDWQTWSAALYLYAAKCVEKGSTPFFDDIRNFTEDKDIKE